MTEPPTSTTTTGRWWLELEVLWLILIVAIAFFIRLEHFSLRGEETRRAHLGKEMLRTGDWLVPRQQDKPVFFRPPLQNWIIAAFSLVRGECDVWAARLPSAVATLLMTLVIYGYSRVFLSRLGAFTAAVSYPTMFEVLRLGGRGETEALFTLFVSGSLLIWHWGYTRRWPDVNLWVASYGLAGLGMLTKGTQAPIYFGASVTIFLLLRGQWRRLFTRAHLIGILTFAVLFGAWVIPYAMRMGWGSVGLLLGRETTERFDYMNWTPVIIHLIGFPLQVLGCTAPWSLLLLFYLRRAFRRSIGDAYSMVLFAFVCLGISFPTVWFAPEANTRYWMPLYPCFGALIGLVVQRSLEAAADSPIRRWWTWYVTFCAACLCVVPIVALAGGSVQSLLALRFSLPPLAAVGFALTIFALIVVLFRERIHFDPWRTKIAVFALACSLALSYSILYVNALIHESVPTAEAVAEIKQEIGNGKLVSFGKLHHPFIFHLDKHVPQIEWPKRQSDLPSDIDFFCFNSDDEIAALPFTWEKIAEINCDGRARRKPIDRVIVGKLTKNPAK